MRSKINKSGDLSFLKIEKFTQVFPWIGGDLQTIRDTFCFEFNLFKNAEKVFIPVNNIDSAKYTKDYLLGFLEFPNNSVPKGLVIVTHGLGGSTKRYGLRRISKKLLDEGYIVFKLNLRGAGSGRYLSSSNYSAKCSKDIISVVSFLRNKFKEEKEAYRLNDKYFPIFGIGLSLGGTIFLNACIDYKSKNTEKLFDGLACVSSPLDLLSCSQCIDKPRNFIYQKWLISRLKSQVLKSQYNNEDLIAKDIIKRKLKKIKTIREFDDSLTAPSWGYKSVNDYYQDASPLSKIITFYEKLPVCLFIHAKDDPWVPYKSTFELKNLISKKQKKFLILITEKGGHNGFHSPKGCWSDNVVSQWINHKVNNLD